MIDRQKIHEVARDIQLPKPIIYAWHELERVHAMKLIDPKRREAAARYNFFRAILVAGGTDYDIELLIDEDIIEESDWQIWVSAVNEYCEIGFEYLLNSM